MLRLLPGSSIFLVASASDPALLSEVAFSHINILFAMANWYAQQLGRISVLESASVALTLCCWWCDAVCLHVMLPGRSVVLDSNLG